MPDAEPCTSDPGAVILTPRLTAADSGYDVTGTDIAPSFNVGAMTTEGTNAEQGPVTSSYFTTGERPRKFGRKMYYEMQI
jgi:hypothetical protein